jgi:hypothetical protein
MSEQTRLTPAPIGGPAERGGRGRRALELVGRKELAGVELRQVEIAGDARTPEQPGGDCPDASERD